MKDSGSFFDSKTLLAIILVGASWLGWQIYLTKKYPNLRNQQVSTSPKTEVAAEHSTDNGAGGNPNILDVGSTVPLLKGDDESAQEQLLMIEDAKWLIQISSKGMGLASAQLKEYNDRDGVNVVLRSSKGQSVFETRLLGTLRQVNFEMSKVSDYVVVGTAKVGDLTIKKSFEFVPGAYEINTKIKVEGKFDSFLGLSTYISNDLVDVEKGSIFFPQFESQEVFAISESSVDRLVVSKVDQVQKSLRGLSVVAMGSQYFTQALVDKSPTIPELEIRSDGSKMVAQIKHSHLSNTSDFEVNFKAFVGPKSLSLLRSVDANLVEVINMGFFGWLARPMLDLMKWFYSLCGNWGIAIILLTLTVRTVVLPLYLMSFKSMAKMKLIQPKMVEIRERLKDDQQKMNQEIMLLMKDNKVNPLGGCLPLLLQFPVFIALYQVFGHSIELYQEPFFGWISDLSLKDPFYVLPVLMGITMFVQQKITPTAMDPIQEKVFMFMPILFSVFMLGLPSGLTLYIFVSSLFGITQQFIFMRDQTMAAKAA